MAKHIDWKASASEYFVNEAKARVLPKHEQKVVRRVIHRAVAERIMFEQQRPEIKPLGEQVFLSDVREGFTLYDLGEIDEE